MSLWIKNFKTALENKEVLILHGNVRDRYISQDKGIVYGNLTEMILDISREGPLSFTQTVFYDIVGQERRIDHSSAKKRGSRPADSELADTSPPEDLKQHPTPDRLLERWLRELSRGSANTLAVLFYLDKLVSYRERASYPSEDRAVLLLLEKLIENITPNNRLILVALQDGMVPVELYTNSPKTCLNLVPMPDKVTRRAYLRHRLGTGYEHLELAADLTEGLYLRDLDNIVKALQENKEASSREIRKAINKYRLGEQEDYWGTLDIEKLDSAVLWFTEGRQEKGRDGGVRRVGGGVKGQDDAVRRVIDVLTLARAGLSGMASGTLSKPKGVLFFAGPTGVGKTFLAKKLAEFLFGTEEAFIRFDMSEFKEEHTVSKLLGSPPGFVGYEQGGMLTNAVRQRPFSVVLFDEIEKAHPKIMDIFLQILDEGRLTDSRGQTVFFTETVIIFTSNIGTRTQDSQGRDIRAKERDNIDAILRDGRIATAERMQKVSQHFQKAVESFFMLEISRPELLNRIGSNIIPFNYIDIPEMQEKIVESHFGRIKEDFDDRFRTRGGHKLELDGSAVKYLVQKHRDRISEFGGRAITNSIEDEILKALSIEILRAEFEHSRGITFRVEAREGKIAVTVSS
jgi:energy-coupling factor transporter ATP-binding protein EcfA2